MERRGELAGGLGDREGRGERDREDSKREEEREISSTRVQRRRE